MKINHLYKLFIISTYLSINLFAQGVAINSTGTAADASAILDVSSTTQGFLPPRMTEIQRDAISSPATGLLIYQTNGITGLYYYSGTSWETFITGKHYIGESYGGGIVFYVDATGQHGLIAATSDQSTGIMWWNGTARVTNATGDGVGAGEMNTALIIAMQTNDNTAGNFVALLCGNLVVTSGGVDYGDWYLPSKYELNLMYNQKAAIGGFSSGEYWTSTELEYYGAWWQNFSSGLQIGGLKNALAYVRAIRKF